MDYKIVSPADYFGNAAAQSHGGTLLMNPHVVHGASVNPHGHGHVGGEIGLNVLASGAIVAGQTQGQSQGQGQYGATDNYGYIVNHNAIYTNFTSLHFLFYRGLIIELLIIIQVRDTLKHPQQLHPLLQISQLQMEFQIQLTIHNHNSNKHNSQQRTRIIINKIHVDTMDLVMLRVTIS